MPRQLEVIVGRNATVILADRPNTLHVLLTGRISMREAAEAIVSAMRQRVG